MTPQQLYDRFRSDVVDVGPQTLWSDDEVWGYMDDAQRMLCRLTDGIRDASSDATQVQITANYAWVDVDPSVLRIRGASLVSTGAPIRLLTYSAVVGSDNTNTPFPTSNDAYTNAGGINSTGVPFPSANEMNLVGTVTTAIADMEDGRLRLVRIPTANDTLSLIIERLPLVELIPDPVSGTPPGDFEVRQEHHLHLLLRMKELAYAKQDAETFDKGRSDDYAMKFLAYCTQAKYEKDRRKQTPRLMAYGGL